MFFSTLQGFGTYTALTGAPLTPDVTFSALSLFNMLTMPLMMLPMSLLMFINGVVSTNRVQKFLAGPEVEEDSDQGRQQNGNDPRQAGPVSMHHSANIPLVVGQSDPVPGTVMGPDPFLGRFNSLSWVEINWNRNI